MVGAVFMAVLTTALVGAGYADPAPDRTALAPRPAPGTAVPTAAPTAATPRASPRPTPESAAPPMRASWHLVGLGDSVTAASACACAGFVDDYAALLRERTGATVAAENLGVPGETTAGLLAALAPGGPQAAAVAGADIVTVTIGANDLVPALATYRHGDCGGGDALDCFRVALPSVGTTLGAVLDRITVLRGGRPTAVLVTDYWNVFADGAVARQAFGSGFLRVSDTVTRAANTVICAAAAAGGDTCVDLYAPFKGSGDIDPTPLLAADGDHPDPDGHVVIAEALADAGLASLAVGRTR